MSSTTTEAPHLALTRPTSPVELVDFALGLMAEADVAGVEVRGVTTSWHEHYPSVSLNVAEDDLTPALAVALGLTKRSQQMHDGDQALETFEATIAGVWVFASHRLPALIVRDGVTGEHLTGPLTPDHACQVIAATTDRNVEAVAA